MAKILRISYESHKAQFPKLSVFCWPELDITSLLLSKCLRYHHTNSSLKDNQRNC